MRAYIWLELKRTFRSPGFLFFTVILPLVTYLIFTNLGTLIGTRRQIAAVYSMVAIGGYSAIGALLNYGSGVVADRGVGWLRQLRLSPISPASVILGKAVTAMVLGLPPILFLCAAGAVINGVRLTAAQWLAVTALLWLGSAPFALLGLGIGYLCSAQMVVPANFFAYFGLSLVGGLLFPLTAFPHWLQQIGRFMPTHGYAALAWRAALVGHDSVVSALVTLAVWFVLFGLLARFAYLRSSAGCKP